jgi:hypothetical protein
VQLGQCCEDSICPLGYGCCNYWTPDPYPDYYLANQTGTVCCPTEPAGGDADAKDLYCEILTLPPKDPTDLASFPRSFPAGCLLAYVQPLPYCNVTVVNCNASLVADGSNDTVCAPCGNNTAQCNVPNPIKCANVSDCQYINVTLTPAQENATGLMNVSYLSGCCPGNETLCLDPVSSSQVGCADTTAGYSCCGSFICPPFTQCCTTLSFINTTQYLGCCPDGVQCCMNNVAQYTNTTDATDFFCGAPFNGTQCQVNRLAESRWYVLTKPQFFGNL